MFTSNPQWPCPQTLRENAAPELYRDYQAVYVGMPLGRDLLAHLREHGIEATAEDAYLGHALLIDLGPDANLDEVESLIREWVAGPENV